MAKNYDIEILHVNCDNLINSLVCFMSIYHIDQATKWRYNRLLQEVGEFRLAIWGDRLPAVHNQ